MTIAPVADTPTDDPAPTPTARLVEILQNLVPDRPVLPGSDFFADLGADSMTMTRFCARVRKTPGLPTFSMREIYAHPSVGALVTALDVDAAPALHPTPTAHPAPAVDSTPTAHPAPAVDPVPAHDPAPATDLAPSIDPTPATSGDTPEPAPAAGPTDVDPAGRAGAAGPAPAGGSSARYLLCGVAQAVLFVVWSGVLTLASVLGYAWIDAADGVVGTYLRAVVAGGGGFLVLCATPVVAKWLLVGRWAPGEIPLWSPTFLRWWIVKSLLHTSPVRLFIGTPVYPLYLRALGARIGPGVTILSKTIPVCTDLLTIGAGSVIRNDSVFLGYRAEGGVLQVGPVTLGRRVFVGEKTVLDIDTAMGDRAQLGHASALQHGERIPDDAHWHGSPAVETPLEHDRVPARQDDTLRRATYALTGLLQTLLLYIPFATLGFDVVLEQLRSGSRGPVVDAVVIAAAVLLALPVLAVVMFVVPRVLNRFIVPGRVYRLHGRHHSLQRAITTLTNRKLFTWLFGDSSYIVGYLRALGYRFDPIEQTGSNFGTEVAHGTPFHVQVGTGTMVADGLSILNVEYSASSFRVSPVRLGARSFLGNNIALPPGARVGDNCLLATKVMVPLDGEMRHDVGLLGSPAFEIPRTVERDTRFDHLRDGETFTQRLRAKNRYNLRSITLMLGARWVGVLLVALLAVTAVQVPHTLTDVLLITAFAPASMLATTGWFILVERVLLRFGTLAPRTESIYEPTFWRHERLWKVPDAYLNLFNATPAKSVVWRLLGVRIGRRVFDDGAYLTERTLTTIGDDVSLNATSKLQAHSQEDGTFKSDRIAIGARATLGVGAFIHYGTEIGQGAVVGADSFLMKGEQVPAGDRWHGNPASPQPMHRATPAPAPIGASA